MNQNRLCFIQVQPNTRKDQKTNKLVIRRQAGKHVWEWRQRNERSVRLANQDISQVSEQDHRSLQNLDVVSTGSRLPCSDQTQDETATSSFGTKMQQQQTRLQSNVPENNNTSLSKPTQYLSFQGRGPTESTRSMKYFSNLNHLAEHGDLGDQYEICDSHIIAYTTPYSNQDLYASLHEDVISDHSLMTNSGHIHGNLATTDRLSESTTLTSPDTGINTSREYHQSHFQTDYYFLENRALDFLLTLLPPGTEKEPRIQLEIQVREIISQGKNSPLVYHAVVYLSLVSIVSNSTPSANDTTAETSDAIMSQLEHMQFHQAEAITLVKLAVENPGTGIDYSLFFAVLCLCFTVPASKCSLHMRMYLLNPPLRGLQSLDQLRPSQGADMHMQALLKLINLWGGIETLKLERLRPIISLIDITLSSHKLTSPMFPLTSVGTTQDHPIWQTIVCTSSIERSPFLGVFCSARLNSEIMEVFFAAKTYEKMVDCYYSAAPTMGSPSLAAIAEKRNLIQHHLLSLNPAAEMASVFQENHKNYEPCRIAMLIYSMTVIYPLAPESAPFELLVNDLCIALTEAGLDAQSWDCMNWLLLWILTVGAIAAVHVQQRHWFVFELSIVLRRKEISSWAEMKEQLTRILWLEAACEVAGQDLWNDVKNVLQLKE